jgi:hypothetical protein
MPKPLFAGRRRVGRELDPTLHVDLLEAFGEQLEHHRTRLLRAPERYAHGDALEIRITHHPTT